MRSLVLDFFILVLGVAFEFVLDVYYKNLGIALVLSKKRLKFLLGYENVCVLVNSMMKLVLGSAEANAPIGERDSK